MMTGVLYAIARFCARQRFLVVAVWLVAAIALVGISHRLGDHTSDSLTLPGTDSQRATDALQKSFPTEANGSSPIVLHVSNGKLTDSKYASAVNEAATDVAKTPDVASVVNPLTPQGASALSKDGSTAYLSVTTTTDPGSMSVSDAQRIIDAASKPAQAAGIQVQTGGLRWLEVTSVTFEGRPGLEGGVKQAGSGGSELVLTPSFAGTTTIAGVVPIIEMPAKSRIGSNARSLLSRPRMECPELANSSV